MAEVLLSARRLVRRFGGLTAVDGVSIDLWRGRIHAVIGPNGAGKSTLANLLSGELAASAGSVQLAGRDVSGWSADALSRQGLGRSFQKTDVFLPFSVWDNVFLAAQSRDLQQPWNPMRWLSRAAASPEARVLCDHAIELCGLSPRREAVAATISHGEQRQLEIAMALATRPQVLLLDEPLAGMGSGEAASMVALLQRIKAEHAILLVEHDMDAVFALADHLTVMVDGRVIASGDPAVVRTDPRVQAAYLGEDAADAR